MYSILACRIIYAVYFRLPFEHRRFRGLTDNRRISQLPGKDFSIYMRMAVS